MNNSYLVSFADLDEKICWIERFEGRSLEDVHDKIRQYIEREYNLEEEIPLNYKEMKDTLVADYCILIGNIEDLETL